MSFFDDVSRKVKQKAEEWDVQGKAEKLAAEVDKVAHEAKDKAAELADDNRGKIRENLDKAGAKIDERTDGKYADKVAKAKDTVAGGVDKLAEQRPGGPTPPGATARGGATSSGYASGAAAGGATAETYTPEPYRPDPIDRPEPIDEPHTGTGWPQEQPPRP
jgi:MT0933-like antitoxin protein